MRKRTKIAAAGATLMAAAALVAAPASAATPPSTSPSVSHKYYSSGADIPACASGYACAIVAYGSGYYVFNFYTYGTYSLSNWIGQGGLTNAQTGGASVRVLNSSGTQIDCLPAEPITYEVNWSPAWKIRLTSSGC